jgi:type VI secretion system protein ImpH
MEFAERQEMADLTEDNRDAVESLKKEAYKYNFFQAMQILEENCRKEKKRQNPLEEGFIQCITDTSLVFPPSDIKKIEEKGDVFIMTLTFMGLIGVSSPLPIYFSEYVARFEESAMPLLDFLNIFNHRCYTLFYRAWKKYRVINSLSKRTADSLVRSVACLSGINPDSIADPLQMRLLAYTGLMAGKCRGKSGLASMLSNFFSGLPVSIKEYVPRWVPIRNPSRIGEDVRLGINSIAGTTKWDIGGKFRICVGPLSRESFSSFLPGTENIKKMKGLVVTFLADPLDFDIEVQLQSCDLVPVVLGKSNARLAETASLGKSSQQSDIKSVVIE